MKRRLILAAIAVFALGSYAGYAQRGKPTVSINANLATYTLSGAFNGRTNTQTKVMTLVTLTYNSVTIPCVVAESGEGSGGIGIDCDWPQETLRVLTEK